MGTLKLSKSVYLKILDTIGKNPPECGGVLGTKGDGVVTEFYYDTTGKSTPTGYAPDVATINNMLINDWMPRGVLMVGIVHSHAKENRVPSCGDVGYGIRILQALDTVDFFYLPIITSHNSQIRLDCYMICRDEKRGFECKMIEWDVVDV